MSSKLYTITSNAFKEVHGEEIVFALAYQTFIKNLDQLEEHIRRKSGKYDLNGHSILIT